MNNVINGDRELRLNHGIINGPTLMDLNRSHMRHTDDPAFDVCFTFGALPLHACGGDPSGMVVKVQSLERPRRGKRFWKILASCEDIAYRSNEEVNVVMLYDPAERDGYCAFVDSYPGLKFSARPRCDLPSSHPSFVTEHG